MFVDLTALAVRFGEWCSSEVTAAGRCLGWFRGSGFRVPGSGDVVFEGYPTGPGETCLLEPVLFVAVEASFLTSSVPKMSR